ncbi:exocyst complex component 3-like protein isoform X7 [Bos javanicus]|uniref:exocyst complex component 3-like protein isoform X7 n=1 Tax=Bos javanicus TaxID=9906 RepID=UPI002AA7775B|nr:exocyst complex component 3-like protein isoform X7 [Bos javanicus]
MLFPVGNEVPETQLPSFLPVALERAGPGGRRGLLRREVGQRLPWAQRGAVPSGGPCLPCPTSIWGAKPGNLIDEAPPAMDSAARDKTQPALPTGLEWPEQERAEQLARGAALKWASGIFYRPEQLARLGQYRNREVQRTCSLEARIKSVVQSYLEGVKTGVWQLAQALEAVQGAREALGQARGLLRDMAEAAQTLEPLREQVVEHKQLQALSQLLPRLRAVPAAVAHTQTLIDAQRLLEAYVSLRELEQLQEETCVPLGGLELPVFEGLGPLAEALGQAVEAAAGAAGQLARENPALLVAAVRVAEVDAGCTTSLEQAPRDWRQRCLRALQQGLERVHFGTSLQPGPGELAKWLEALRVALPAELAMAEALVAPCCPPHYKVVQLWAHTLHGGLRRCLQQLLEGPELEEADTFTLLHWVLHVYQGPEMMGSLELGPEADVSDLEPLLTLENIEQLEATFVAKVQAKVAQWLQKALDGEVVEWGREQEPDTDLSGFYHSPLPAIVLQLHRCSDPILPRPSQGGSSGPSLRALPTGHPQPPVSTQPKWVVPGVLAPVEAELDKLQKRICRLVLEALLAELQPLFAALPSRRWLSSPELLDDVCKRTARFCQNFQHVRNPAVQLLLVEAERTVVLQYLSALMQGRLVCRGADERTQAAERMQHDAAQLQELFLGLGLEESVQCVPVLLALKELLNLRDPTLLGLEVAGLRQQFPDVRCEDGPGREETQERLGGANAPVTPQRGSRLRPPGPARRRVPRAAPGRTQLSAGRPAALAPSWSPSTFQPRANTCTLAGLLLPLRVLCLTPDCPQNKVTSPYA